MPRKILRVYLQTVLLNSNGIPPGWDDNKPHNLIVATLRYPRSGAPSIASTKQVKLENGNPLVPAPGGPVWESLIFKEQVDDETELQIKILYHRDPSKLEGFLKDLFGLAAGAVEAVVEATGVLGIIVGGAIGQIADKVSQSGPDSVLLGQTNPLPISVIDPFTVPVAQGITNTKDRNISYFPPGSTTPASFTIPANNGEITLRLQWEAL